MQYVFGPVPSRRLGRSLGIDPVPKKTCNRNCVYCQLGRTEPLTNERREYIPRKDILAEVAAALKAHTPEEIDWLTFVGSGEPTLHAGLGCLIRAVKGMTPLPVAVITNGALLYLPEVRAELAAADAVMPTLDAGTPDLYRAINRPHPDTTFARVLEGLVSFRQAYAGRLWVEVMLIRGLNDTVAALEAIAAALDRVGPDAVHINLPTRPPAEPWVQPPDDEGLMRAIAILGAAAQVVTPSDAGFDLSGAANLEDAVVGTITRHPMRDDELRRSLARCVDRKQVDEILANLVTAGRARVVTRHGVRFWCGTGTHYAE